MMLRLLRFFRGYVRFSIDGRYPERFINITSRKGVRVFDASRTGEFTACMYMSDYLNIRSSARGAKVRLRIIKREGLPCFVKRYRSRIGVLLGALVFLTTVFIMSLFVWSIDISGLDSISRSEMISLLRDNGLYIGAFRPSIDNGEISRAIMIKNKNVGWMAVNIIGSYVSVEVKEEALPPKVDDNTGACNIKASRDGLLLSVEAYNGKKVIPEGSGVIRGTLIVSGVMGGEEGTPASLVHAKARVWARTKRDASFSIPDDLTGFYPTGEIAQRNSLKLFGVVLPLSLSNVSTTDSFVITGEKAPAPMDVRLPVGEITENIVAISPYEKDLDEKEADELLKRQSMLYESFVLSECIVTDREYDLIHKNGVFTLKVTYTCEEDIAMSEPIGTDEAAEEE